jgi:hypothetical protein
LVVFIRVDFLLLLLLLITHVQQLWVIQRQLLQLLWVIQRL